MRHLSPSARTLSRDLYQAITQTRYKVCIMHRNNLVLSPLLSPPNSLHYEGTRLSCNRYILHVLIEVVYS